MRGGCWVRAPLPAWRAGLRGGAGQGRAYPGAALRGWRHQGEGVIQEGVHLLSRLLNRWLGGHVGWWHRGGVEHLISRGRAAVVWRQVRVRLYETGRRENKVEVQCGPHLIWLLFKAFKLIQFTFIFTYFRTLCSEVHLYSDDTLLPPSGLPQTRPLPQHSLLLMTTRLTVPSLKKLVIIFKTLILVQDVRVRSNIIVRLKLCNLSSAPLRL